MIFCIHGAELEAGVLATLTWTASHHIAGNLLELRDAGGERLALYAAQ